MSRESSSPRAFGAFELYKLDSHFMCFRRCKVMSLAVCAFTFALFTLVACFHAEKLSNAALVFVAIMLFVCLWGGVAVILDNRTILIDLKSEAVRLQGRWGRGFKQNYSMPVLVLPVFIQDSDGIVDRDSRTVLLRANGFEFVVSNIMALPRFSKRGDYIKYLIGHSNGLMVYKEV